MGRSPCCEKAHTNKGAWTKEEDNCLTHYIRLHGEGCWHSLPKAAGLLRCGKSCRLRWINYLRPDLKRGNFTQQEDELIIKLHTLLGNKWSLIAARLPGRTDNEIKNYWNTHIKRKLISQGIDPQTHRAFNYTKPSNNQLLISKPGSIFHTINFKNSCPDSNDKELRSDSNERGTCCNSSTTDDGQKMGRLTQQMKAQEIDLELSIGLSPFRAGPNNFTFNSAQSKEFKPSSMRLSPEKMASPASNEDGDEASGVFRYIWPLGY